MDQRLSTWLNIFSHEGESVHRASEELSLCLAFLVRLAELTVFLYVPHVTFKTDVSHLSGVHDAIQKREKEVLLQNKTRQLKRSYLELE